MVEHYLLSVCIAGGALHAYVMTEDEKSLVSVLNKMVDIIEEKQLDSLNIFMQTKLDSSVDVVHNIIKRRPELKEAADFLAVATNQHLTIFGMDDDHPDNQILMALH